MSETPLHFPEYGLGGDDAGARRGRRAFLVIVAAVLLGFGAVVFSDTYLRYSLNETQYVMALTLEDSSARAILRNVEKRDREQSELRTVKYVHALADIEESDVQQERFEEACQLASNNASLIIDYGCFLFHDGQYLSARERFREASILPPKNALPRYLEAAALAAGLGADDDFSEVMALIARTNSSGAPLIFPKPLWHPSLPAKGVWYAKRRMEAVNRYCSPLYALKDRILAQARRDLEADEPGDWNEWLGELETLGRHLVGMADGENSDPGLMQAIAGVRFQMDAVAMRRTFRERGGLVSSEALLNREAVLADAFAQLSDFSNGRPERIDLHRTAVFRPLWLALWSVGSGLAALILSGLLSRVTRARHRAWALPHTAWCHGVLAFGVLSLLTTLSVAGVGASAGYGDAVWVQWLVSAGYWVQGLLLLFGLVYPALALPSPKTVTARSTTPEEVGLVYEAARRARNLAYIGLVRRYYGIVVGLSLCVAFWCVGYRVFGDAYPLQVKLIVTGLGTEELELVRTVQKSLS